jgi:hypothetical protein
MKLQPRTIHGLKIGGKAFLISLAILVPLTLPFVLLGVRTWGIFIMDAVGPSVAIGCVNGFLQRRDYID